MTDDVEFALQTCETCPPSPSSATEIHQKLKERVKEGSANHLSVKLDESSGRPKLVFSTHSPAK